MVRIILVFCIFLVTEANAQKKCKDFECGWYLKVGAGTLFDTNGKFLLEEVPVSIGLSENDAVLASSFTGGFGYKFKSNFRLDSEFSYLEYDIDAVPQIRAGGDGTNFVTHGSAENKVAMLGLWYDLYNGTFLVPFVGVQSGLMYTEVHMVSNTPAGEATFLRDWDFIGASQGTVGIRIQIPLYDISTGILYRYLFIADKYPYTTSFDLYDGTRLKLGEPIHSHRLEAEIMIPLVNNNRRRR